MKYKYVGTGEFYAGIPAQDLSDEAFEKLSAEQKKLVQNSKLYKPEKVNRKEENDRD